MNDVKVYTEAKEGKPLGRVWRYALLLLEAGKRAPVGVRGFTSAAPETGYD